MADATVETYHWNRSCCVVIEQCRAEVSGRPIPSNLRKYERIRLIDTPTRGYKSQCIYSYSPGHRICPPQQFSDIPPKEIESFHLFLPWNCHLAQNQRNCLGSKYIGIGVDHDNVFGVAANQDQGKCKLVD